MSLPMWIGLGVLLYWQFLEYLPGNPLGGPPMTIAPPQPAQAVRAGDEIVVQHDYTILRDCRRRIEWWFDNHERTLIRSHDGSTSGGGLGRYVKITRYRIPASTQPGPAVLRSRGEFWCNELNPWRYVHETHLQVLPRS